MNLVDLAQQNSSLTDQNQGDLDLQRLPLLRRLLCGFSRYGKAA